MNLTDRPGVQTDPANEPGPGSEAEAETTDGRVDAWVTMGSRLIVHGPRMAAAPKRVVRFPVKEDAQVRRRLLLVLTVLVVGVIAFTGWRSVFVGGWHYSG